MINKKTARLHRATRTRVKLRELGIPRLVVHRSSKNMYAQIIIPDGNKVLATASTLEEKVNTQLKYSGNIQAATEVGKLIAQRAIEAGIKKVGFDRSGFKYHGRVKALAEAAREVGLEF